MSTESLIKNLKKQIADFKPEIDVSEVGAVVEIGDAIARMNGLDNVQTNEMLLFPGGTMGVALNLEEETVGAILLGEFEHIKEGDTVKRTGRVLSLPVSDDMVGHVINPLGEILDGSEAIKTDKYYPIEKIAPGVMKREPVSEPVHAIPLRYGDM